MFLGENIKKGSIIDIGFLTIFLVAIIVGMLFSKFFCNKLFTESKMQEIMNETETGQAVVNEVYSAFNVMNYGIVLIFVGLYITSLILAYRMTSEGAFLVFAFIIVSFFTFLAAVLSHIYTEMITNSTELMTAAQEMNMAYLILNKMPWLIFFGGMLLIAIMYVGGEGGYE